MQYNRIPTRSRTALALTSCAVALAACGGSGSKPNASTGPYGPASSPAALSRFMRAHGVSGFPDPFAGPTGAVGLPLSVNPDGSLTANGQTFAGPVLRSAERACSAYLPPGGPAPAVPESEKLKALAFARCMRAHGVPNFPDPTLSPGGGPTPQAAGVNPNSPAVLAAGKVCGASGGGNVEIPG